MLKKENPNAVIVDSGNFATAANTLDIITSVMADMKYDAVGMGAADIRLGDEFVKTAKKNKLTVLDALSEDDKSTVPYVIKSISGVKVGIVSFNAIPTDSTVDQYQRRKAWYSAYKAARTGSDVLIVLDQSNTINKDWLERNGTRLGSPDVVIGGVIKSNIAEPEVIGTTRIVPTSVQAKEIGVVDFEVTPGQTPIFEKARRLALDTAFDEDKVVAKRVGDAILANVQKNQARVTLETSEVKTSPASTYYSPMLCKGCHLKQYEDWKQTKHAHAMKTLTDGKAINPECLSCHSEMYRKTMRTIASADGIGGVECATCHADSLPHGMERREAKVKTKVDPIMCETCHTHDRSPAYNEKIYFPKVAHSGTTEGKTASTR